MADAIRQIRFICRRGREGGCHQMIQSVQLFEEEREDYIYRGGASIRETGLTLLRTSKRLVILEQCGCWDVRVVKPDVLEICVCCFYNRGRTSQRLALLDYLMLLLLLFNVVEVV